MRIVILTLIFTSLVYIFSIPLGTSFFSPAVLFVLFSLPPREHSKNERTWHHKNAIFHNILSVAEQELCLNIIPTFANLIDYPSMKNSLIPRIKSACLQTSSLAVSLHRSFSFNKYNLSVVKPFKCLLSFSNTVVLLTFTTVDYQPKCQNLAFKMLPL